MFAVEYGHMYLVEYLLTKLPLLLLNSGDAEGTTALMLAIMSEHTHNMKILELLLQARADTELLNGKNKSALLLACEAQNTQKVGMLFDYKVERNEKCLALLHGLAAETIRIRIKEEEVAAIEAYEKEKKERFFRERDGKVDLRFEDPTGKWILIEDKRSKQLFYYNTVSRLSQRKEPLDYIPDTTKPILRGTYGMHFYHF